MKAFLSKFPRPTSVGWMWLAAVGSASLAIYAGKQYLGDREAALRDAARAGMAGREVVVAAHELQVGSVLAAGDLALREVPERFMPSGSLGAPDAGALIGRRVRVARRSGEVLQHADIETATQAILSSRVASGQRAVTLAVDELGAVSGLMRPGDEVDLYFMPGSADGDARIGLLLSRVPVLATGPLLAAPSGAQGSSGDAGGFSAITVQLLPEDAERVSLAQRAGQVLPVLRRPGDEPTVPRGVRSARSLFDAARPISAKRAVAAVVVPERLSLEVIVGGQGSAIAGRDSLPIESAPLEHMGGR